ncbi:2-oxoglutarate dehydrogenase complex dihydrolipoyllysine-residue succinyltransferase [Tenuifilum sp.]|uniref:2-oxoglutarate dehydrogenase complex dihydrolipoyllysine-residue succinyltransferase n=1 Tax=Tenuifilum sp. TaxID=2760880 RepID=UPI002C3398A9|nr:2-oxoglutarate dehydrogenase complex dihydrolipoyllysine-residue succinyltransferase [Tenuifilum sp.]HQE53398.1 2-oxoglutarate dehydrogenase complex dihydrolipoyllysine-residue succinyltransferase [Tenuifilum sp.]HQG71373.1 2-oxoglutarate dehydrogenase complex dihydrolipoyllysine-residue succinyltransferase [Tenuifilum sp.]HQI87785.1 2-oxoglutarate dehydrogenase complex dihydrolipoyllysine-residue succinyltransferase [Tenuifilum sp.]HRR10971.1 2-oxoglutarate dehydrogenase complex dihydrolipo
MIVDVRIPSPGESISEVELTRWLVSDGDIVEKDQEIAEVESEKATLPIIAPEAGKIALVVSAGMIKVNEVCCRIDTSFAGKSPKPMETANSASQSKVEVVEKPKVTTEGKTDFPTHEDKITDKVKVTPLARELMHEYNMNIDDVLNGLRRITAGDVQMVKDTLNNFVVTSDKRNEAPTLVRSEERIRMSQLRKKVSERLVTAKNTTAMLTTFNEVDMSRVQEIRARYQTDFQQKFGVKLGLMSFFVRAAVEALRLHPMTNSMIDGEDIVTPSYIDMGIAVQTPKGLMVPVLRNAQTMSFAEIEKEILRLATKAREGRITLDELNGGTFTITNGGIFGSMLSTPILNYPQSAILGMHNIVDRPVAVNGKVEIRPIMYVALSYDHRIIDGKDSAAFLMDIKRMIENPEKLLFGGDDPIMKLIGL